MINNSRSCSRTAPIQSGSLTGSCSCDSHRQSRGPEGTGFDSVHGITVKLLLSLAIVLASPVSAQSDPPNILVIGIDDLRPELNCYGATHIHSPNIDRLAERGALFERAYAQYAICGPSRSSMFTGLRPDTIEAYNNKAHFRDHLPDVLSLPEFFKNNGYATYGFGKILHNTHRDPQSWTEPQFYIKEHQYASTGYESKQAGIDGIHESNKRLPLFEGPDVENTAYRDGIANVAAIETLESAAKADRPFFLFVGYHKPHTPFNAPKKYWDLYDPQSLPLAPNPLPPLDSPNFALSTSRYLRSFAGMPENGPFPEDLARKTRHAYFACISYVDALVGDLVDALEETGQSENTIIALWSDHGYQLGDHGMWSKHSNFETSTKIPFIIVDPRASNTQRRIHARIELIDLFPTLAELAGLEAPIGLDGKSLVSIMNDPSRQSEANTVAFSQFHRAGNRGYSIRTRDFRYTEWRNATTKRVVARELYDHRTDPNESRNVARRIEYRADLNQVQKQLQKQWPR